jgi:hypothetical protein
VRARIPLLLAVFFAACTPRVPPPDLSLDPAVLLEQVRARAATIASVRGAARVRATGQGRVAVPAFVAAQKPDRLRLEALDFFGNPVAVLVAAGGRLAIYDSRDRAFYRGAATPENVGRLVPLAIAPEELVAILCGAPVLSGDAVRAEPGRGHVTLEVRDGARATTLRIVAGAAVEHAMVRTPEGAYEVSYAQPYSAPATAASSDVRLSSERPPVRIDVGWGDVETNVALEDSLFGIVPPGGARIFDLDAGAVPALPPVFPQGAPGS